MIENRYDDILRTGNQQIIDLTPSNYVLRIELASELANIIKKNKFAKILEIGFGEGNLTKFIMEYNPNIKVDCLDISSEMIESSKKYLPEYLDRINFIEADALEYLEKTKTNYEVILSAWTLHNFKKNDRNNVYKAIFNNLAERGSMMNMDKYYQDNVNEAKKYLNTQLNRYQFIGQELREAITEHEHQDFSDEYRMNESSSIKLLSDIGFKNIRIVDRVERELLLVAEKIFNN